MKKKKFSNSSIYLNPIGFGSGIGGYNKKINYNKRKFHKILDICHEKKIQIIDTSPAYGNGMSERLIGSFNKKKRQNFFLATKILPEMCSFKNVFKSVSLSLKRLKTKEIDLLQIHWPNPSIHFSETLDAMFELKRKKIVKFIGLCNYNFEQFKKIFSYYKAEHIDSLQLEYNLFERSLEKDFLPFCIKNNVSILAYSPLAQGKFANGIKQIEFLKSIAKNNNITLTQNVLSWLVKNKNIFAIPNTTNFENILENSASNSELISANDFHKISNYCKTKIKKIDVKLVRNFNKKKMFNNLRDAKANTLNLSPSPIELAKEIKNGIFLKPIRLKQSKKKKYLYELTEGGLRFWSWIIAFGKNKKIPALVWKH